MGIFKGGKVVIMLAGRFAGRKAVVVKATDDGNADRRFGNAVGEQRVATSTAARCHRRDCCGELPGLLGLPAGRTGPSARWPTSEPARLVWLAGLVRDWPVGRPDQPASLPVDHQLTGWPICRPAGGRAGPGSLLPGLLPICCLSD